MSDEPTYVISGDVLAAGPEPTRWGRRFAVGGAALAVVVLAGGGYAAYGALSGGGTHPEKFVPANAVAYVEIDLNPPASQKINSVRLLHKLPKGVLKSTSDNYRDLLLSSVFSSGKINYDRDIKPWLGDRAGLAVLPPVAGGSEPTEEGVLQVKDEAAFKKAAPKLFAEKDSGGYVLRDGFVIIADDSDIANRVSAAAAKADLSSDSDFNLDTAKLGDRVVTGWYDATRAAALVPKASRTPSLAQSLKGRGTFAVHVESNAIELVANQTGGSVSTAGKVALLPKLPSDTAAAFEVTGAGARVMAQWDQLMTSLKTTGFDPTQLIERYEQQYNVKLPQDLETLLGSDTAVAVTVEKNQPAFGYLAVTKNGKDLVDRVTPTFSDLGITAPTLTDNGIAWGSSPTWSKDAQSGDLGSSALVKNVLPDLASAQFALYVDLDSLVNLDAAQSLPSRASLNNVEAVGVTASSDGSKSQIRIRVAIK